MVDEDNGERRPRGLCHKCGWIGTGGKARKKREAGGRFWERNKEAERVEPGAGGAGRWNNRDREQSQRSGHAARPGSQALWVSVGSRCFQGAATDGPQARGSLLTPGPGQPPRQPALAWRSNAGPKRQMNDSPAPVGLLCLSSVLLQAPPPPCEPREAISCHITLGSGLHWRGKCEPQHGVLVCAWVCKLVGGAGEVEQWLWQHGA